ncbi:MAG TPA: hypothetical protein DCZ92_10230 [Elusimicrobia bacterium]|nr:hypothetical protein [Elusimicrobiota bacterium]
MPPYSFDDKDRALAAEARKKEFVEAALLCDNCYASLSCKHFRANRVCGLREELKPFANTSPVECLQKIKEVIADLEERAWLNLYFERLDGGMAGENVSGMMDSLIRHHKLLAKLYAEILPSKNTDSVKGSDLLERIFGAKG